MFRRRELLQSLMALPLLKQIEINGKTASAVTPIPPGHYMMFVDARAVDSDAFLEIPLPAPGITMDVIPVHLSSDQTIEDVVRIYKIDQKESE